MWRLHIHIQSCSTCIQSEHDRSWVVALTTVKHYGMPFLLVEDHGHFKEVGLLRPFQDEDDDDDGIDAQCFP